MSGDQYQVANEGDTVLLTFTWRSTSGALATPSTTTFRQRKPSQALGAGTSVTTGWTTTSTGVQIRNVIVDEPGLWRFEVLGDGGSMNYVQYHTIEVIASKVTT